MVKGVRQTANEYVPPLLLLVPPVLFHFAAWHNVDGYYSRYRLTSHGQAHALLGVQPEGLGGIDAFGYARFPHQPRSQERRDGEVLYPTREERAGAGIEQAYSG